MPSKLPTHKELVVRASTWLKNNGYNLVITEAVTHADEIPDAMGWRAGKWSALIECKVSRSDFKKDAEKPSRKDPSKRIGQRCYYMAPKGVLLAAEIPTGWGFLEVDKGRVYITKPAPKSNFSQQIAANELLIVTHLLRRAEIRGFKLAQTWTEYLNERGKQ